MNRKFLVVPATTILFLLSTIDFAFSQRKALERETDTLRGGKR